MKLFKKVHCKAYLKKTSDGVYIRFFNPDGSFYTDKYVYDTNIKAIAYKTKLNEYGLNCDEKLADLSEFDGESVEKVYRTRIEQEFDGFVVGYTRINTKGKIGTYWEDGNDYVREYGYCFKEITESPKVAVVYFMNNCKRYVLLDDLEVIE
jgi:hypothetical protein